MQTHTEESLHIQPTRLKNLLKNLVDIYSPSGKEEEIVDYVYRYLKRHHLTVTRQEVDEDRYNLVVFPENKTEVEVCLIGHLDTVTAYDLDEYRFREENDTVSGLGTADMKSGCAAMIEAFVTLAERGDGFPPIGLALVVDEEENNEGAKALVKDYKFPWAIIGEPTNLAPCLGHYSYMEVLLRTLGKRAHSAMPEFGHNAIEAMLKLMLKITQYAATSPQGLVYNIRELSSFRSGFIVSDFCEAWLDMHLPPDAKIDETVTEFMRLVKEAGNGIPGLDAQLSFENIYPGYRLPTGDTIVERLQSVYQGLSLPWKAQQFRSHSDGNLLYEAGINPIILGPGRLEAAHTPEESASFQQIVQAAEVYLRFSLSL